MPRNPSAQPTAGRRHGSQATDQDVLDELLASTPSPLPVSAAQTPSQAIPAPIDDDQLDLILPDVGSPPGLKVEIEETFHLDDAGNMVPGEKPSAVAHLQVERAQIFDNQRKGDAEASPLPRYVTPPAPPPRYVPEPLKDAKPIRRYASRVDVLEAWQFPGNFAGSPGWIDNNWLGYHDGVVVMVPQGAGLPDIHCRKGDWVVYQERQDNNGKALLRELVVYPDHAFNLLFREIDPG
jgi:hypothetical protein